MKPKRGVLNEIVASLLGKAAGKVVGGAIKGGKDAKAGFKQQVTKAKQYDADDALRKKTRNQLDKVGKKKAKPNKGSKVSLKNKNKRDNLSASLKASEQIMANKKKEGAVNEMNRGQLSDIDTFAATFISEGFKKTERQFKGTAKEFASEKDPKKKTGKLKRMVKLAKKHQGQKDKSMDRKAERDVKRQAGDEYGD